MAEQRYTEAQQLLENILRTQKSEELLGLYLEIHLLQGISLPYEQTIEFIKLHQDHHKSLELLGHLDTTIETRLLELKIYELLGDLDHLYNKISELYLFLYERKIPRRFDEVMALRKKFFSTDFNLELKELALELDIGWGEEAEAKLREMIRESIEKSQIKNKRERLIKIENVLNGFDFNNTAKIYSHFLSLYIHGIQEKADYKKVIEVILYFDEMEFKAMTLSLLDKLELIDVARKYAEIIRKQNDFKYIYIEKYHSDLKHYFINARPVAQESKVQVPEIDLTLESPNADTSVPEWEDDSALTSDFELAENLKHLEYDITSWLNLASSFLQSDFNKSAFVCARKAKEKAENNEDFLKSCYLAIHALLKQKDYRLALDYCYEALERSEIETDLLSFYYLEAELLINLGERKSAKKVLDQITALDRDYRLSAKMLKRLNEI